MASIEELRNARIEKINLLKDRGMDPYPSSILRDYSILELKEENL